LDRPRSRPARPAPWLPGDGEWARLLDHILTHRSLRDQALLTTMYDGALRREEVTRLRVEDVDWTTHQITIRPEDTKGGLPGSVILSNTAFRLVEQYVRTARARLAPLAGRPDIDAAHGPLFLSEAAHNPGQPLGRYAISHLFDRLRADVGLPQLRPHILRHLALTHLLDHGLTLYDVSRYARHRSVATTQIYVHPSASDLARTVAAAHRRQWEEIARRQVDDGRGRADPPTEENDA
jgi:integrase/recombinase XerC